MGHRNRGQFLQDGWLGTEPVHIYEHYTDDSKVFISLIRRDAADRAVPRSQVAFLPDRHRPDTEGWQDEECIRLSGEQECEICLLPFWKHPRVAKDAPTLVRACDGRLLKL
jgi:hypothetical protein